MSKNRVEYVDRLKGFAMLSVVIGHLCAWDFGGNTMFTELVSTYHMPLFMLLSGLVISAPPSWRKCLRKIIQFMMPAVVVGLVYSYYKGISVHDFFFNCMKFGFWYLFVLAFFYILLLPFNSISTCEGKKGAFYHLSLALAIYAAISVIYYLLPGSVDDLLCVRVMKRFYPAFMLGFFMRRYGIANNLLNHNWMFTVSLLSFIACLLLIRHGYEHLEIPTGLVGAFSFFWLFKEREHDSSFIESELARIGRCSLDVYIYHVFFLHKFGLTFVGEFCTRTNNLWMELLLLIVTSLLIAYSSMLIGWILKRSHLVNDIVYGNIGIRLIN